MELRTWVIKQSPKGLEVSGPDISDYIESVDVIEAKVVLDMLTDAYNEQYVPDEIREFLKEFGRLR